MTRKGKRWLLTFLWAAIILAGIGMVSYGLWFNRNEIVKEQQATSSRYEAVEAVATTSVTTEVSTTVPTTTTLAPPTTTSPRPSTTIRPTTTTSLSTTTTTVPPTTTTLPTVPERDALQPDALIGTVSFSNQEMTDYILQRTWHDYLTLTEGNNADEDKSALLGGLARTPNMRYTGNNGELIIGPELGYPGSGGNIYIGGHRTTHIAPFGLLDVLDLGDAVYVTYLPGVVSDHAVTYTYRVMWEPEVVNAATHVFDDRPGEVETLTLFTCNDGSRERIIVTAVLESVEVI